MGISHDDSFFLYDKGMKPEKNNSANAWAPLWSQAMAKTLFNGASFKNTTSCFTFKSYVKGNSLRLRFNNRSGKKPVKIGSIVLWKNQKAYHVNLNQNTSFEIPIAAWVYSDILNLPVEMDDEIEVRIYFASSVCNLNHTEMNAKLYRGNQTTQNEISSKPTRSLINKMMGLYPAVPVLDLIEIYTMQEPKVIVAFGDSITAMNHWVKPLRERIHHQYQEAFYLMNAGISGNCLLYEIIRPLANLFGRKGTDRFEDDVLSVEHLHTLIFALGINDISYYHKKTKNIINFDNYTKALMRIADQVHERKVRIVVCTLTPRLGFKRLKFTNEMEMLRVQINEWIRSCGYFDEVFDMDAVLRDAKQTNMIDACYHQGDHLHPNRAGGQRIADAIDLDRLVGEKV